MAIINISLVFLLIAVLIALFTKRLIARIIFSVFTMLWLGNLYFYSGALLRGLVHQTPNLSLTKDLYVAGMVAYKNALGDFKVSVAILMLSLIVLAIFPQRKK